MKLTTMETVAGRINEETLGVVRGSALWTQRIMKNSYHGLRGLSYGDNSDMADGLEKAREAAEKKAMAQARELGADAIIGLRLEVFEMTAGMFTAVATGTAVRTSALPAAIPAFNQAANDDDEMFVMPYMSKPVMYAGSNLRH
jgi:uncharacterized protein YbjQ (UPF0145 family)